MAVVVVIIIIIIIIIIISSSSSSSSISSLSPSSLSNLEATTMDRPFQWCREKQTRPCQSCSLDLKGNFFGASFCYILLSSQRPTNLYNISVFIRRLSQYLQILVCDSRKYPAIRQSHGTEVHSVKKLFCAWSQAQSSVAVFKFQSLPLICNSEIGTKMPAKPICPALDAGYVG